MSAQQIEQAYQLWCERALADGDIVAELAAMVDEPAKKEDAFYRELAFGTGGLRGVIGAGSNRMNIYTVAKASQGLASYLNTTDLPKKIAISYDSRIKSGVFAKKAAEVFAANGLQVYLYDCLMPTPCLSYAVRALGCGAGVMVTASHNPAKYNGYKVYGADGCQITIEAADLILAAIEAVDVFDGVASIAFDDGVTDGRIAYIPQEVYDGFVAQVKAQSVLGNVVVDKTIPIIYTPLNGTGLQPVLRTLRESGYCNVTVVKEQEQPDGNFPTCPYPNPEMQETMKLGIAYAKENKAYLVLATDPDCDRVGIAVRDQVGEYQLLSGNEVGMLLLEYLCARRLALGTMPENPVLVKTVVTIDLATRIASAYGVKTVDVLTGFKFIGEQIAALEAAGHVEDYLFGFEESYGYLSGSYVRDKDGVNAAFLICEMVAYYQSKGVSLVERLAELYQNYGYCLNTLHSYTFEGASGFAKMNEIMSQFRENCTEIADKSVKTCLDYTKGINGLPKSNVLKFHLEGDCSVVVRPSGTEPKLKLYLSVQAEGKAQAMAVERELVAALGQYVGQ